MFDGEIGTTVEPYMFNNAYHTARLLDSQMRPNEMKASHILIAYAGAMRAAPEVTRLKVDAKVSKKTAIGFGFHNISFAQEAKVGTTTFKAVGNNIDLQLKHGLGKGMALIAGYSVMLPSDKYTEFTFVKADLAANTNAKFHQFAWLMFKFTPTFLKTEAKKEAPKK